MLHTIKSIPEDALVPVEFVRAVLLSILRMHLQLQTAGWLFLMLPLSRSAA